jgi:molybdate transport system substrate-binding protein
MTAALLLTALTCAAAPVGASATDAEPLVVFAAVSLTDALGKVAAEWSRIGNSAPRLSFAASSALARQVEAGARADVFVAADQEWMDYLAARGLIRGDSRRDILGNRLVLIAPADSVLALKITAGFPLAAALGRGRLATGDPDIVPVGRYARTALTSLGVWGEVADRLVRADNVRVALAYVARGEAPLGIVYATDAQAEPRVRVIDTFPADSHAPITYPAAVLRDARPRAQDFLDFLRGEAAGRIFAAAGFLPAPASRQ